MEILNALGGLVGGIVGFIGAIIVILILYIMFKKNYIKAAPDEAVIVSGKRKNPKIAIGEGVMCLPFVDRHDTLTLRVVDIDVKTSVPVPTADFIGVQVDATVNAKIPADNRDMLLAAAQNFLNMDTGEISRLVQPVLEGNIREIIGRMELKTMVNDRQKFAQLVKENAEPDLANLGLEIKTFNVQNFSDEQGVIQALGVENETKIKKDAAVSKAQNNKIIREEVAKAEREANEAEVESKTAIAERENEFRINRASLKRESDAAQAEADVAYSIREAEQRKQLEQSTVDAEIARTEREVELKRKEVEAEKERLEAEIAKRAEVEKYKAQQEADAELYNRQRAAEAEKAEIQAQAEADAYSAIKEAEAEKARAEAKRYAKEQEAEGIAAVGKAEAAAIEAKGIAEAEAIDKKAEAMQKYGQAAILEMVVDKLPEMAKAISEPMTAIDNVSIIGGDASGVAGMSDNVPVVLGRVFESVKATTGLDIVDLVAGSGRYAQTTRNINVTSDSMLAPGATDLDDATSAPAVDAAAAPIPAEIDEPDIVSAAIAETIDADLA